METWDAIRARRNVRQYEDRPVPDDVLDRILEAARRTPSSSNKQRWDFVVVTDRETLGSLSQVWQGAGHVAPVGGHHRPGGTRLRRPLHPRVHPV